MKSGKVFLGILAGLSAGALLGILFAPDKGCNTRKMILNKGEDYTDALKEKFNDLVDVISSKYDKTRDEAEDWVGQGKEKFEQGKAKFEEAKKDVKNAIA